MPSELEVAFNFDNVLVARRMIFDQLQDFYFQLKLVIEFLANLQDLQGIFSAMLMVHHFQHLNNP